MTHPEVEQTTSEIAAPIPDLAGWLTLARRDDPVMPPFEPRRILVIGGGSGHVFGIAAAHPDAEVLAVDEDPAIVAVATGVVRQSGLGNLAFWTADLDDPASLPGQFDWIHCADPVKPFSAEETAWRTLADHLAPHGLLTARLRSRRQHYAEDNFREAIGILAQAAPPTSLEEWMRLGHALARDLGQGAASLAPIARQVAAHLERTPPHLAALALLPAGHAHTLSTVRALLAQAGLSLYGFLDAEAWSVDGILADPELHGLVEGLSLEEQEELIDILRAPDYLIVCGHSLR